MHRQPDQLCTLQQQSLNGRSHNIKVWKERGRRGGVVINVTFLGLKKLGHGFQ
jgi:hypothetical protein